MLTISAIEFSGQLGHADYTLKFGVSGAAVGTKAEASWWISDSALLSLDASGVGSTGPICVSVGQQCGTLTEAWTYDAPSVSAVRPRNQGSQQRVLTVFGSDFAGQLLAGSSASGVGETNCEASTWTSQTALICKSASFLRDSNYVYVTVVGTQGSITELYSYNTPRIFRMLRRNNPTSGSTSATILGVFFGTMDISDELRAGYSACEASTWRSDSAIQAQVSYGLHATLEFYVTANIQVSTMSKGFTYDEAISSSVSPVNAILQQATLLVFGNGFLPTNTFRIGRTTAVSTGWLSDSQTFCRAGSSFLKSQLLLVTAGMGVGTQSFVLSYDGGVIINMGWSYWVETYQFLLLFQRFNLPTYPAGPQLSIYRDGSSMGPSVFIVGQNFVFTQYSQRARMSISICESTMWLSNSLVRCRVPAGVMGSRGPIVTAGWAMTGSSSSRFSYDIPNLSDSRMMNGPSLPGVFRVTVRGANMGIFSVSVGERGGSSACENTLWSSSSSISGRPAAGLPAVSAQNNDLPGETYRATVGVQVGSRFGAFSYDRPRLSVFPANHPTTGSISILLLVRITLQISTVSFSLIYCSEQCFIFQGLNLGPYDSTPRARQEIRILHLLFMTLMM
jgi:hypothetical protein